MNDKAIRECYSKILKEVIEALKEDVELQSQLTHEQIQALEEVNSVHQSWQKNLSLKDASKNRNLFYDPNGAHAYRNMHNAMYAQQVTFPLDDGGNGFGPNSRGLVSYGLPGNRLTNPQLPRGPTDLHRSNIIFPQAIKEVKQEPLREQIYLEDDDNGLLPGNRKLELFSKFSTAERGSAFRSTHSLPQPVLKRPLPLPVTEVSLRPIIPKEEPVETKPTIQFNIGMDVENESENKQSSDGGHDSDDDDHLFDDPGATNASSQKPQNSDAGVKMLDKREAESVDNYEDDYLFNDPGESKPEKVLVKHPNQPNPTISTKPAQKAYQPEEKAKPVTEMEQKLDIALQKQVVTKPDDNVLVHQNNDDNDDELNSKDDISDCDEEFDFGGNILLGYYVKSKRKKDKRKIQFKNCVLRFNGVEYLIANAKGEFTWAVDGRRR